jgi:hypothetical protein
MVKFDCKGTLCHKEGAWHGYISKLAYYGNHMEISISMDEPITAVVCKTPSGFFVYFPYYETGSNLASLFDSDDNAYRLAQIFFNKKAVTVACAIAKVGYLLSKPRRRRRNANKSTVFNDGEMPF